MSVLAGLLSRPNIRGRFPLPNFAPTTLGALGATKGMRIGYAIPSDKPDDPVRPALVGEFTSASSEYVTKHRRLEGVNGPAGNYTFATSMDQFLADCAAAQIPSTGLVWHTPLWGHPPALPTDYDDPSEINSSNFPSRVLNLVDEVWQTYGDIFFRIDGASEVFNGATTHTDTDHIEDARVFYPTDPNYWHRVFRHIRDNNMFPSAKLFINDFGLEGSATDQGWGFTQGAWEARKRDWILTHLTAALNEGVPIDGVSMRGHLSPDRWLDLLGIEAWLQELMDLGLQINCDQFDVWISNITCMTDRSQDAIDYACLYARQFLDLLLASNCNEIVGWHPLAAAVDERMGLFWRKDQAEAPAHTAGTKTPLYDVLWDALEACSHVSERSPPPAGGDALLLDDGASSLLLDDGTSELLLGA